MDEIISYTIRASGIVKLLTCGERYMFEDIMGGWIEGGTEGEVESVVSVGEFGRSVASVYGDMVHGELTGHVSDGCGVVRYDRVTRTEKELGRQVAVSVGIFRKFLADFPTADIASKELELKGYFRIPGKLNNVAVNVEGHVDMLLDVGDGWCDLVDFKTGFTEPEKYLPQMAIYCWLLAVNNYKVRRALILSLPRGEKGEVRVVERSAKPLVDYARSLLTNAGRTIANPVPVPNFGCYSCRNKDCILVKEVL